MSSISHIRSYTIMKFRNLKLGTKQKIGFGSILLIMALVNGFSVRKMVTLKSELDEVSMII